MKNEGNQTRRATAGTLRERSRRGVASYLRAVSIAIACGTTSAHAAGEAFEMCFVPDESALTPNEQPPALRPPILATRDLIAVQAVSRRTWTLLGGSRSESEVLLTLSKEGAERLEAVTSAAVGRHYVVLVNGEQVEAGVVMRPLSGTHLAIAGSFSAPQAKTLARQLQVALSASSVAK